MERPGVMEVRRAARLVGREPCQLAAEVVPALVVPQFGRHILEPAADDLPADALDEFAGHVVAVLGGVGLGGVPAHREELIGVAGEPLVVDLDRDGVGGHRVTSNLAASSQ
jgi:hypothetical protein